MRSVSVAFGCVALFLVSCAVAQEKPNVAETEEGYRKELRTVVDSITFSFADNEVAKLVDRPIFSWSNPQRLSDGGLIFMWTKRGRPFATFGIWKFSNPNEPNGYEFQSLSSEVFEMKCNLLKAWVPKVPGVNFRKLTDTEPPEADSRRRSNQMRQIARDHFSAEINPGETSQESLRLVATPVYHYDQYPEGVIDGAVFSFAQGTDPEVLLILEARKSDSDNGWYYAMAPSTSHGVSGKCKGVEVLRRSRLYADTRDQTYQLRFWKDSLVK